MTASSGGQSGEDHDAEDTTEVPLGLSEMELTDLKEGSALLHFDSVLLCQSLLLCSFTFPPPGSFQLF